MAEMTDDELGKEVAAVLAAGYTFGGEEWSKMHDLERQLSTQVGRRLYDMGRQAAGVEVVLLMGVYSSDPSLGDHWEGVLSRPVTLPAVPCKGDYVALLPHPYNTFDHSVRVDRVVFRTGRPALLEVDVRVVDAGQLAALAALVDGDAPWGTS